MTTYDNSCCRLCLENPQSLTSLFSKCEAQSYKTYAEIAVESAAVVIDQFDGFPQNICLYCASELDRCNEFRRRCEENDQKLRDARFMQTSFEDLKVKYGLDNFSIVGQYELTDDEKSRIKDIMSSTVFSEDETFENLLDNVHLDTWKSKCLHAEINDLALDVLDMASDRSKLNATSKDGDGQREQTESENDNRIGVSESTQNESDEKYFRKTNQRLRKRSSCEVKKLFSKTELREHRRKAHSRLDPKKVVSKKSEKDTEPLAWPTNAMKSWLVKCCICECDTIFEDVNELRKHRLQNHRQNTCARCPNRKVYPSYANLQAHWKFLHPEEGEMKIHNCPYCDYKTRYTVPLKRHISMHRNERPFKCNICVRRFVVASELNAHKTKMHERSQKFICSVCGRGFPWKSYLETHHRLKHTSERKFACPICNKQYKTKTDMQKHVNLTHCEPKFTCVICSKKLHVQSEWRKHFQKHTGRMPTEGDVQNALSENVGICEEKSQAQSNSANNSVVIMQTDPVTFNDQVNYTFNFVDSQTNFWNPAA